MSNQQRLLSERLPRDGEQFMVEDDVLGEVIIVEHRGVQAYKNSCPHIGVGMDYGNGDCLFEPGVLLCSLHGALFEADTGLCIDGPCRGDHLSRITIAITDEGIAVPCTTP
jgi:nitrite reductase/ring-hydroxylating ferredoxin subunit